MRKFSKYLKLYIEELTMSHCVSEIESDSLEKINKATQSLTSVINEHMYPPSKNLLHTEPLSTSKKSTTYPKERHRSTCAIVHLLEVDTAQH